MNYGVVSDVPAADHKPVPGTGFCPQHGGTQFLQFGTVFMVVKDFHMTFPFVSGTDKMLTLNPI